MIYKGDLCRNKKKHLIKSEEYHYSLHKIFYIYYANDIFLLNVIQLFNFIK